TRLVDALRARHGPLKALVFGSLARGDVHTQSDLDLLLVGPTPLSFRARLRTVLDLAAELGLERPVEPLWYTPEEWEDMIHRPFLSYILTEAREV
ncbi:MAG TPA: nucleotidyltransferase domain-containing protein, partial [Candidatus Nitrosotenuis sp.]|nr:nucleotidyltransferase domain-containing protein [Candidatus Nitrosotenuis sp.]